MYQNQDLESINGFLKRVIKCIIDEAGGVMGATSDGMGHHLKCENDTGCKN